MVRNRKSNSKKERMIMIGSSAFVLAALTMTGLYMRQGNMESQDNGYVVDFTALEDSTNQKLNELAQNNVSAVEDSGLDVLLEDDLDYMPYDEGALGVGTAQVGSGQIQIPGVTDKEEVPEEDEMGVGAGREEQLPTTVSEAEVRELHFSEENGLIRPVSGTVIMPYSMNANVYFKTLNQYTSNPAVVFDAEEGTSVSACAEGQVVSIYEDSRIGRAVTLDLGDGYQVTYGQLKDIQVAEGDYVDAGEVLAAVSGPTKYYVVEGPNLYFKLTRYGAALNPEELF
ncbi:MAG: M23 family metallopeptidase [Acetatifactor sp.]|nr:M23 family metallopeptidase [Acetatifactor sp.]